MSGLRITAAITGGVLLALSSVFAVQASTRADNAVTKQTLELTGAARTGAAVAGQQLDQARLAAVIVSRMPSFAAYATADPDATSSRERGAIASARTGSLATMLGLGQALPALIGTVSLRDVGGAERARVAGGLPAGDDALSPDPSDAPWFEAATELKPGQVYQSAPYTPQGGQQVVATAVTVAEFDGTPAGVLAFETPTDSLWIGIENRAPLDVPLALVDGGGNFVAGNPDAVGDAAAALAEAWTGTESAGEAGVVAEGNVATETVNAAYAVVPADSTLPGRTALDWRVVSSGPTVQNGWGAQTPLSVGLFAAAALLLLGSLISWLRSIRAVAAEREQVSAQRDELADRISEISDALAAAADGDLAVQLPIDGLGDDTLKRLAVSFDETLRRLATLVAEAQESGRRLASASSELRANASQQAGAAQSQQEIVTETTATIEELAATAAQIAVTTQSVADAAAATLRLTEDGRLAVGQSLDAMDQIAVRVDSIADRAGRLGEKSSEIGRILEVIDDLADRTNLLALNAAIEAARAGEHGRGFAVVAAEVRKLAERAQESTGQIQAIVAEISAETSATVLASQEGAAEVHAGVELARGVEQALERISGMVDETTTAAKEISIATQQQRSASDQVVSAMTQVSDATRQHAAGSTQAAESAEEMAHLAARLRESIASFHTA